MEVLFGYSIVFPQHSFCLIPEVFNAVNMVVSNYISLALIDAFMPEFCYV